jgi:hypothetical protein
MNFCEAMQAINEGKVVRLGVNPEKYYRLDPDTQIIVSTPINGEWADKTLGGKWRPAIFFPSHIRACWCVVEGVGE